MNNEILDILTKLCNDDDVTLKEIKTLMEHGNDIDIVSDDETKAVVYEGYELNQVSRKMLLKRYLPILKDWELGLISV